MQLVTSVTKLEGNTDCTITMSANVQCLLEQAKEISSNFKTSHLALVDLIADEEVDAEQATLEDYEEKMMCLTTRLHQLATEHDNKSLTMSAPADLTATPCPSFAPNRYLTRCLVHILHNSYITSPRIYAI